MKHALLALLLANAALAADANRLTYLDDPSPFWPGPSSPRFTTPQWVGEAGVEAVVILAIDDMRDPAKYETFLRPILDRLKRIDGRAPVSIMTNEVKPGDPQLQAWLREGLSLEVHTLAHPCPLLGKMSLDDATKTVLGGVDLLASVPGNRPVAFRMPCCDSMNSASPRFFEEILSRTSEQGHALAIDSSVFTLPPGERFAKYFPSELRPPMKRSLADYAGYIADYPYPYVIGRSCWEFPCFVPSDWEAFNVLGPKSPTMLDDWKAALDDVVSKQGAFTAVFHPHGWSDPGQWVEFIDYAERTYGKRVKFLNFREALERLEKHALAGHPLRARLGPDNGVRLIDVNADGFMDVVIGAAAKPVTRVWQPKAQQWSETSTPANFVRFGDDGGMSTRVALGVVRSSGAPTIVAPGSPAKAWTFREGAWQPDDALTRGLPAGVLRFRDLDRDGTGEALTSRDILAWSEKDGRWQPADFAFPSGFALTDTRGGDNGLRFADLNGDGFDDLLQSNDSGFLIHLWAGNVRADLGWKRGWSHLIAKGAADTKSKLPPFVKEGQNYGAWFHRDAVVWQNEDVATPESESVRRRFKELIAFDVPALKSPQESLAAMRPRPGFTVELVAAEPLVESPVAFAWDARGRMWVAEMRDYPLGMDGKGGHGGVVKVLTDEDGDGRYDRATAFAEGLGYPTGVFPWRDGVIVAATPDILFLADRDGDGRADERRVLFTGFKDGNQQHRMNGFTWGLDGWLYGANGDSGGKVNDVSISGRDFRFRPGTGQFEAASGQAQYGRPRDDWGNWFGNNNSAWLWHYTLEEHHLRRNPKLAVKTTKQPLAQYSGASRVFTIGELPIRFNQPQSLGHITSGCSPEAYRDDLFGADFATSFFICEPVHNVVHREVLSAEGASFTSRRAEDEGDREFIASTDPWFRPVCARTGPDGALYLADMHRFVLEHPEWIAPETQSRLDLRAGADKGRIYRVIPTGAKPRSIPKLASLDSAGLAAALDSPSGWQRDTAQQLLTERNARDAAPAIRAQLGNANPKVRLQALATLDTLRVLEAGDVRSGVRDAHPGVRVQALRVSESLPELPEAILACADDPEFVVRRQLALALGTWRDPIAEKALAKLAAREGELGAMRIAIQSSLRPESESFAKLNTAPTAAAKIPTLPKPTTTDRAKVIAGYTGAGSLTGNAVHGRELFQQQCAICHRLRGEGVEVGPDLAMTADKPLDWLLTAIFDPNAAIEPRYQAQLVKTKAGAALTGILSGETANNLTLRLPGGTEQAVLRDDLAAQEPLGRSLMPEGLEAALKPQDVADVLAWLRAK